jgi:chaperone BCS1
MKLMHTLSGLSPSARNGSADDPTITSLPLNALEAFIPGYSLLSGFFFEAFGLDASVLVPALALAFAVFTSYRFIYRYAFTVFETYLTSSISIEAGDDIHEQVMHWLGGQRTTKSSRSLVVRTGVESTWDPEDDKFQSAVTEDG